MKKFIYAGFAFLAVLLISCEQEFPAEQPEILSFTFDSVPVVEGDFVTFNAEMIADQAVMWFGVDGSDYQLHTTNPVVTNTGTRMSLEYNDSTETYFGSRNFRYDTAGVFTAVLVATSIGDLGETLLTATEEIVIDVAPDPEE